MDQFNDELNTLFAKYRAAVPDPDPSANFMPELWRNIEARQTLMLRIRKLTQIFVGAAAAVCLLVAMIEVRVRSRCGWRIATSCAIAPPIDAPATCAVEIPSASSKPTVSSAMSRSV